MRASCDTASRRSLALIAGAALLMGLPTLRGGFVGGDDHRLALDHVLVNHPSWEHAVALFKIVHRDLYQPLPLLTFQLEFVVVDWLGLKNKGPDAFGWFFHLNNILLHAANAVLVYLLLRRIHRPTDSPTPPLVDVRPGELASNADFVPATVGLVFAVHPFQTETVAWLNGRMTLLSTFFLLTGLLALSRSLSRDTVAPTKSTRRWLLGSLTLVLLLCCHLSKVRVEIPILMLIVVWATGARWDRRLLAVWLPAVLLTAFFAWLNIHATAEADLFTGGEEHLKGPRLVRVAMALAFYFQHLLWPTGLASFYPAPPVVTWSDPESIRAILIVAIALSVMIYAALFQRSAKLGSIWFFAAIAATLPFFPARNTLAADRYTYVPIIGLLWLGADVLASAHRLARSTWAHDVVHRTSVLLAATVSVLLIGVAWYTGWFYEDPLKKTYRVAMLYPDVPRSWERVGWTQFENGDYEGATESAQRELRQTNAAGRSGATQLLGMLALRQGRTDEALDLLHRALEMEPEGGLARTRLAAAYDELNRPGDALPYLEAEVRDSPQANPTLHRLASVYKRLHRLADARRCYEQELRNNAYEWRATVGLAELELAEGTPDARSAAERRLRDLLAWMPDNVPARVNLGVVLHAQGRTADAMQAYEQALQIDPANPTAALNLAQLHAAQGNDRAAAAYYLQAAQSGASTAAEAAALVDYFLGQDDAVRAAAVADDFTTRFPLDADGPAIVAWVRLLCGDVVSAHSYCAANVPCGDGAATPDETTRPPATSPSPAAATPFSQATCAYLAFVERRYAQAIRCVQGLDGPSAGEARRRLLGELERFDRIRPEEPWTFCLVAELLLLHGQSDAARAAYDLCRARCGTPDCAATVDGLRERLASP